MKKKKPAKSHHIYVIELKPSLLGKRQIVAANPGYHYSEDRPLLYVGMTGRSPELRYAQHCSGYKASRYTRSNCVRLRRDLFEHLNPMVITVKRDPVSITRSLATKRGHPEQAQGAMGGIMARFALMDKARRKWNGAEINTDQIMAGDFSSVENAFRHHGLEYSEEITRNCIEPDKWHKWK